MRRLILVWFASYLSICILELGLLALLTRYKPQYKTILFLLHVIIISTLFFFISYLFIFNTAIDEQMYLFILRTNLYEVWDFLTTQVPFLVYLLYALFVIILAYTYYLFTQATLSLHTYTIVGIIGLGGVLSIIIFLLSTPMLRFSPLIITARNAYGIFTGKITHVVRGNAQEHSQYLQDTRPYLYVVIIGESVTRLAWNAYGYYRNTTPFISSQLQNPSYILMNNVFAPSKYTDVSVPYMLSSMSQYTSTNAKEAVSLLDILNNAGIHTVWISNQIQYENTKMNMEIRFVVEYAKEHYWLRKGNTKAWRDDAVQDEILSIIKKYQDNTQPTAIFIHLYGSHFDFCQRYNKELYTVFTSHPQHAVSSTHAEDINCYDNSIYATDQLLESITKELEKNPNFALLTYISDHGEGIYLDKKRVDPNSTPDVLQIPFYLYIRENYRKHYPTIVNNLKSNINRGFTADMLFDTLIGIFKIKADLYTPTYDISSEHYSYSYETLKTFSGTQYVKDIYKEQGAVSKVEK